MNGGGMKGRISWVAVLLPILLAVLAFHQREQLLPVLGRLRIPEPVARHLPASLVQQQQHLRWQWQQQKQQQVQLPLAELVGRKQDAGTCQLQGHVDECCNCTYNDVDVLNRKHVHPVVLELVKTAFFRYFKVNIYCDCPFWPDDGMCAIRACSVCECEDGEVPKTWLAAENDAKSCSKAQDPACNTGDCATEMESMVNRELDPAIAQKLTHTKGWRGINNPWMADGDNGEEYLYINLLVNPERYTGYKGDHAHNIWAAIYSQACFSDEVPQCTEKRVFTRLISGMHASISAHLCADYLLDEEAGVWGPNMAEFKRRLGTPEVKDRVENLHFAYLFVLRAVMKAAPLLVGFEYDTGLPQEDARTRALILELLKSPAASQTCPMPFDEGRLWKGDNGKLLKQQLQSSFQNITRIMDCVGCEKCKLWGKLQTLGVATALKILFSAHDCSGGAPEPDDPFADLTLERNEVIALLNLLARFSDSLEIYHNLTQELHKQEPALAPAVSVGAPVT